MSRPASLPPVLGDAFTYASARAAGASAGRLRGRDLEAPHRGVRLVRAGEEVPDDDEPGARERASRRALMRRIGGYELVRRPHVFYVDRTALGVLRLPFAYDADDEDICVGVMAPHRAPRCRGVSSAQLTPRHAHVITYEGLPVTSPASTWALGARYLTERELIILGDAIARIPRDERGRPRPQLQLATIAQLEVAASIPHRRQGLKLRRALARIRVGCMSVLESEYRLDAADAGLPEPHLDYEVRDAAGRLLGIADAAHPHERVLIEVEGDHHRRSRRQWNRDIEKHQAYMAAGWEPIRLTGSHIRGRRPRAVAIVTAVLARRRRELGLDDT